MIRILSSTSELNSLSKDEFDVQREASTSGLSPLPLTGDGNEGSNGSTLLLDFEFSSVLESIRMFLKFSLLM